MRTPGALRLVVLVVALCGLVLLAPAPARGQDEPNLQLQAEALLQAMTVPERIGQLFLVTFRGDRAPAESAIGDLILNDYVGGVVLLSQNDNLTGYGDPAQTPATGPRTDRQLAAPGPAWPQRGAKPGDRRLRAPPTQEPQPRANPIPLLVATIHDADSLPTSNVLAGYTPVPNNMALGATWQPAYVQRVGEIVGRELAATGVNLLLGPSLDVLERPSPLSAGDLGTHSLAAIRTGRA
jgi:beta-N-acetylhexosaminidase